ncbi:hypothetical protein AB0I37_24985 [Micromonospora purpureochromogenes]
MKHLKPLRCLFGFHRWADHEHTGWWCERCGKSAPRRRRLTVTVPR